MTDPEATPPEASSPHGGIRRLRRGLVEVALIVGSILLAFAIDAAWDARGEGIAERELLETLRAEFVDLREGLAFNRRRWAFVSQATERLLVAQSTGVFPSPAAMDTLLSRFLTPTTFDADQRALAGASASGGLATISDRELRNRLAAWPGIVSEVQDNELAGREFILRVLVPYLSEHDVPLGRAHALVGHLEGDIPMDRQWPAPLPDEERAAAAYRRLLADPSFEPLLVTRYQWLNVGEYDDAIGFVDRVVESIDVALGLEQTP
jgi:hypothetical protein